MPTPKRKNFIMRNEGFICDNCGRTVPPHPSSARNHCPFCLYSKHVDKETPGDRQSSCGALMRPTSLLIKSGQNHIVHRCEKCGKEITNITSPDDNFDQIISLSTNQPSS